MVSDIFDHFWKIRTILSILHQSHNLIYFRLPLLSRYNHRDSRRWSCHSIPSIPMSSGYITQNSTPPNSGFSSSQEKIYSGVDSVEDLRKCSSLSSSVSRFDYWRNVSLISKESAIFSIEASFFIQVLSISCILRIKNKLDVTKSKIWVMLETIFNFREISPRNIGRWEFFFGTYIFFGLKIMFIQFNLNRYQWYHIT